MTGLRMFQDVESRTPPAHIAVIGVTGVGKSTFIRNISGIPFSVPVADNIYQKLETREIRLLSICPSLNKSDEICCSLDTVNLDDKPSYLALSYTWDDKNEKRQDIMVNKKRTHVTPNLFSALKSFRSRKFSYLEELPIWVDALCINQDDEKERVRQVQMMHTIYSQAAAVICLHGLAESESPNDLGDKMSGYDGAVKIRFSDTPGIGDTCRSDTRNLIGITDLLRNSGEKTKLSGILYSHPIKRERMKDSATRNLSMFRRLWGENLSKPTVLATSFWDLEQMEGLVDSVPRELSRFTLAPNWGKYWKAFGAFIKRPWFTCGWVVQEFVHPKTVAFHCGEKYTHFIGVGNEIDPEGPPENHPFHQESLEKITFADILGVWTTSAILGIGFVGFESTLHEPSSQIICRTTFWLASHIPPGMNHQAFSTAVMLLSLPAFIFFWMRVHRKAIRNALIAATIYTTLIAGLGLGLFLGLKSAEYFLIWLPLTVCSGSSSGFICQTLIELCGHEHCEHREENGEP